MALTREQRAELHAAIRDAFSTRELEQLLAEELDENLDELVRPGTFTDIVHDLIAVFERRGTVDQLVHAVAKERPKNDFVQRYVQQHGGATPPESRPRASPVPPQPHIAHRYTLLDDHDFVGRRDELALLDAWADRTDPATADVGLLLLHAIGGAGKSSLTWEWFGRQEGRPWAGRVWWSFYTENATFAAFVASALCYLTQRPQQDVLQLSADERLDLLCQTLNDSPHLIVLDGFERALVVYAPLDAQYAEACLTPAAVGPQTAPTTSDRRCLDPRAGEFLKRVRKAGKSRVLMTTRLIPAELLLAGGVLSHCQAIELERLKDRDALALWRQYRVSGSDDQLLGYFRTFESHPLLVRALAAEVAHCRDARRDFDVWRTARPDFDPFKLELKQARTHILQFALRGLDDAARTLLQNIAAFRMAVKYPVLKSLLVGEHPAFGTEAELDRSLKTLEERGLVGWDPLACECDLHPIVRAVAWATADPGRQGEICDQLYTYFETEEFFREQIERVSSIDQLAHPIEMMNLLLRQKKYEAAADLWKTRIFLHAAYREVVAPQVFADLLLQFFPNGTSQPCVVPRELGSGIGHDLSIALTELGRQREALPLDEARARDCPCYACLSNVASTMSELGQVYGAELVFRRSMRGLKTGSRVSTNVKEKDDIIALSLLLLTFWRGRGVERRTISLHLNRFRKQKDHLDEWTERDLPLEHYSRFCTHHELSLELALDAGQYDIASYHADRLTAGGRIQSDQELILGSALDQGRVALARGDNTVALEKFRFVQAEARKTGRRRDEVGALFNLARLQLKVKKLMAARELMEEVLLFTDSGQLRRLQAEASVLLAEVEQAAGNHDEAVRLAEEAYRLAWCDGHPYAAAKSLADAEKVLAALGAPLPQLPPFDATGREPLPDVTFP